MIEHTETILDQAYKDLCRQVEEECKDSDYVGALIVRVPPNQVDSIVSIQNKFWWVREGDEYKEIARVKQYTINNQVITAAVFKRVLSNTYAVWIDPKKAFLTTVCVGEALLVDLTLKKGQKRPRSQEKEQEIMQTMLIGMGGVVFLFFMTLIGGGGFFLFFPLAAFIFVIIRVITLYLS